MVTKTDPSFSSNSALNVKSGNALSVLNLKSINQRVVNCQYAVRGELAIQADELRKQLKKNPGSLPFDSVISCNIGNPQQLGQQPITFFRQVASLVECPNVFFDEKNIEYTKKIFAPDAIERAKKLLKDIGPIGAYCDSKGIPSVRQSVANFIKERDGYEANPEHIFLKQGASAAVQMILNLIISNENVGVLIPIPQYPLYSATLTLYGGQPVPYYLNEKSDWGISVNDMRNSIHEARQKGLDVRAVVVINPGNPTGNCFSESNIREIIQLCKEEKLVLLADEVYQNNVYFQKERPFISARKILKSYQVI